MPTRDQRSERLRLALLVAGTPLVFMAGCSGAGGTSQPARRVTESTATGMGAEGTPAWLLRDQQVALRIKDTMASVKLPRDFVPDASSLTQLGQNCNSWHSFGCWRSPDTVAQATQALKAAVDSSGLASKTDVYCTEDTICSVGVVTAAGLATYHVLSAPSGDGSAVFGYINVS